jgi:hypothetical protein
MTTRALIAICVALFGSSCNETHQASADVPQGDHLTGEETAVIAHMLAGYSLGENADIPAAFSSLLGTAQAPQLSALNPLKVEYFQEITKSICDDLIKSGAAIEAEDVEVAEAQISEALFSLRHVNQQPVELGMIGTISTVPFGHLNQQLLRIEDETDNADNWWKEFDETFPGYAGYASSSRVGFSDDLQVAIVYFSWTAGPTLGVGGFHILKKYDSDWIRIGGFPIWTWTS